MPQFDIMIIFPIVKDLTIILLLYYIIFSNLMVKNFKILKFREKISKFFNFKIYLLTIFKSIL